MNRLEHCRPVVIGGQGFLGRHIVSVLAPYQPVATSRAGREIPGQPVLDLLASPAHHLVEMLAQWRPTVIINCAGATGGTPERLWEQNVDATRRLLTAVIQGAPRARYLHLGSAAEYGASGAEGVPVTEETDAVPVSPYGRSKLAATRDVLSHAYEHGLDAAVLRVFNPLGAHAPVTTLAGRTAQLLRNALPDGDVSLGPLGAVRDFVDARDVAAAVRACVEAETLANTVYNVGSGRPTLARDLVAALVDVSGFRGRLLEERPPGDRSAAVSWQQADVHRLRDEFGWKAEYTLIDSVRALWSGE